METLIRRFVTKTCSLFFCFALCLSVNAASCLAQSYSPKDESQALFDFHSGFWINLHHFLYLEALSEKPQKGPHPAIVHKADAETLNSLSEEDEPPGMPLSLTTPAPSFNTICFSIKAWS